MTADQIWQAVLNELQLQMTRATFETWVKPTVALEFDDGRLVVGVGSHFIKEWLENRLQTTVERTLAGIVGQSVRVTFIVSKDVPRKEILIVPAPEAGTVAVKFYEFDPVTLRGFLMAHRYGEWFWQPILGCVGYATYRFFRCLDKQNEGWGRWHFVSVDEIAATLAVDRQKITGVERKRRGEAGKYWQRGAFDSLRKAGVARIETLGRGKNVSYRICCLNWLPLLVPVQVETLPEVLQVKHAELLMEASIEYEEWEQLEIPTLVRE